MRMRKGQTAMEYLMTYGWAILIIMVVLAVLFYLGVLNPGGLTPSQCTFPAGFTCVTYKLGATSGKLMLDLGQGTGKTIRITGVNCTQNTSADFSSNGVMTYGGAPNNITIASGGHAFVSNNAPQWMNVSCTDSNGAQLASQPIGAVYSGRIYVNYTEVETSMQRIVVGTFTTKYEA